MKGMAKVPLSNEKRSAKSDLFAMCDARKDQTTVEASGTWIQMCTGNLNTWR